MTIAVLTLECATFPSDKVSQCVERVRSDFRMMPKSLKIKVNDKLVPGFDESSHAVIKLSVSKTNVKLPMLNISFINLLLLDASYNGLEEIDDIGHETFPSLRLFNLSFNAISTVKSYVFKHLKEVEILDLSHNCLEIFHYDRVFLKHESLKKLYLNDNLLHSIQSTFQEPKMMSLNFLDFSNNFVTEFSNYDIQIHHLNMNNNSLKTVVIYDAAKMILNAKNNHLEHFFAPRGSFISLDLSNNSFEYFSSVEIEEATFLDLSNNFINMWASEASSESDDLESGPEDQGQIEKYDKSAMRLEIQKRIGIRTDVLILKNNLIDSIAVVKHSKNCREIDFDNNHFENVHPHQFVSLFPMLKRVSLVNNPLTKHTIKRLEFFKNSSNLQTEFIYKSVAQGPFQKSSFLPPLPLLKILLPTLTPRTPPSFNPLSVIAKNIIDSTTSPSTPMTSRVPQAESTTQIKSITMTTKARRRTESNENVSVKTDDEKSSSVWMFTILLGVIILSSIIVTVYINVQRETGNIYRGFTNEAENSL